MRKTTAIVIVLLALSMTLGCSSSSKRLVGTWEMVYPASDEPEGSPSGYVRNVRPIKILNDTHFAFGISGPDGRVVGGGGGYTLEGDTYTEIIGYHWNPLLIGRTVEFKCRIDGDKWHHTARFEIQGPRFNIDEIWRRIETEDKE